MNWKSLTIDQVCGQNKLDIFKNYGTKCAVTDFYILLDGFVLNNYHVDGYTLDKRTGHWMTQTSYGENNIIIDHRGLKSFSSKLNRQSGPRSVLLCNEEEFNENFYCDSKGQFAEVSIGEYPQTVVNEIEERFLEMLYQSNRILKTGKEYITDYPRLNTNSNSVFMPFEHIEYTYNGNKYIRFTTTYSYCINNILSDGRKIKPNTVYWIKVEPMELIVDLYNKIVIPKKLLLAGIRYDDPFYFTSIDDFLNQYYLPHLIKERSKQLVKKIS